MEAPRKCNKRRSYTRSQLTVRASSNGRKLDDEELDSGDDEDRNDRMEDGYGDEAAAPVPRNVNVLTADLGRHAGPRPSDGEVDLHLRHAAV